MKHWILTQDRAETIVKKLDLNLMPLKDAKAYYSAYGLKIPGNTKSVFVKNLFKAIRQGDICDKCKGLGYYDEGHENDNGTMSGGNYAECETCKGVNSNHTHISSAPIK